MVQITGRILKADDVNMEGKFNLGNSDSSGCIKTPEQTSQARIIENDENHIIIQINCSCGREILLRGEYPNKNSS